MKPLEEYPKFEGFVDAYSRAIVSAVLASMLFFIFDKHSGQEGFIFLSIMSVVLFVFVWVLVSTLAIFPFLFATYIARRFKITNGLYFVGVGVFAAASLCLLAAIVSFGNDELQEFSFGQTYINALPHFLASGLIAGIVFWLSLRRSFARYESNINTN